MMTKRIKGIVLILDGPPASGKSTLSKSLINKLGGCVFSYKALGPMNLLSKFIIKRHPEFIPHNYDSLRHDPLLLLPQHFWQRIFPAVIVLEILYKLVQQTVILFYILFIRFLIVDEFLILRITNYINILRKGILNNLSFKILLVIDIAFLKALTTLSKLRKTYIFYVYKDPPLLVLKRFWRSRGHRVECDLQFLNMIKISHLLLKRVIMEKYFINSVLHYYEFRSEGVRA